MSTIRIEPFTRADLKEANEALRKLADLLPVLDKAEACGVDCATYRQIIEVQRERISNLIREFMPDPSKLPES